MSVLLTLLCQFLCSGIAQAKQDYVRIRVVGAYLELRTGPGRVFPRHYIVDRGQWITILKRKTDWFKVYTRRGRVGWVHRKQIESSLIEAGVAMTIRDTLLEDYLEQRGEMGILWGSFDNDPLLSVHGTWKMASNWSLEMNFSQATGTFYSSQLTNLNLMAHPLSDKRVLPYFSLGVGNFKNTPAKTLIGAPETNATTANVTLGLRVYLTRSFALRTYYRRYTAFINDGSTEVYPEWALGAAFFF